MDSSATISFMTHLSAIGSPSFNTVLVVLIVAGLFIFRYFREGVFIFITFFGGSAFALMIKLLVKRPRPSGKLVVDTGYSFPSGHVFTTAMIAFAFAFLIYRKTNSVLAHDITFVLAVIWVLAIGTARVFLRDHYPSDVLGSILLAGAVLCLAVGLLRQVSAKYQLTASRH
ncbi:phosphatase PAP2 family protein [Weissella viridescens]|nr:phosphatase PAP2 family protein [Weissella viridescens]